MATKSSKEESKLPQLKLALKEERRKHDALKDDFNQLRAKVLAFITGELALIALLFATGTEVPHIVYGVVFFFFGISCITASFITLLWLLKAVLWSVPAHPIALKSAKSFSDEETFTEYLCNSYSTCNEKNTLKHTSRVKLFDISLMLLLTGVIILLVIKFGQGTIAWHNIIRR